MDRESAKLECAAERAAPGLQSGLQRRQITLAPACLHRFVRGTIESGSPPFIRHSAFGSQTQMRRCLAVSSHTENLNSIRYQNRGGDNSLAATTSRVAAGDGYF